MLIMVVIGAGYLNNPDLGLLLLCIHWLSGFAAAFTLNHFWRNTRNTAPSNNEKRQIGQENPLSKAAQSSSQPGLRMALRKMEQARQEDGRSFGKLLGDSVTNGVQTMMTIGGYMLIFAVIIRITSYNVCYTKLLRSQFEMRTAFVATRLGRSPLRYCHGSPPPYQINPASVFS